MRLLSGVLIQLLCSELWNFIVLRNSNLVLKFFKLVFICAMGSKCKGANNEIFLGVGTSKWVEGRGRDDP